MSSTIEGWKILVVEDDYAIASGMKADLERLGAEVIGPAPNVRRALRLVDETDHLDAAVLDVTLGDEQSFPVAAVLRSKDVAFLFTTGYDSDAIPAEWRHVRIVAKPTRLAVLARHLQQAVNEGVGESGSSASGSATTSTLADAGDETSLAPPAHRPGDSGSMIPPRRPASTICHDLRNSLFSISTTADVLQYGNVDPARTPVMAAKINGVVWRMAELIDELRGAS